MPDLDLWQGMDDDGDNFFGGEPKHRVRDNSTRFSDNSAHVVGPTWI